MNMLLFDMGLPMIIPSMFLMVLALIPIIILESFIIARHLELSRRDVLSSVAVANLVTTFVGVPLSWFCLTLLEFGAVNIAAIANRNIWSDLFSLTIGAPWVAPRGGRDGWIIFGAMLFLLIPYFFASWVIEYFVARKRLGSRIIIDNANSHIFRAFGKANLASYAFLAILWIAVSYFKLSF